MERGRRYRVMLGVALGLAVFLIRVHVAHGQQKPPITEVQNFEVRGHVREGDTGRGIENIRVDLSVLHGPVIQTTFTRTNGEFQFMGLSNGVYYVDVNLEGFERFRESIEVYQRSPAPMVVMLRKPLERPLKVEGSVVSARELALPEKARSSWQQAMNKVYQQKDLKAGLREFQRVAELAPNYYEAHFQMGMVYQEMGRPENAKQAYLRSVEISKGQFAEPLISLAGVQNNEYSFVVAEEYSRKALAVDANSFRGYYELARALLGQNKLNEAILAVEQCRLRRPEFAPMYLQLANVHIRRGNWPALLGALEEYLKYEPSGPMSDSVRQRRDEVKGKLTGRAEPALKN